MLRIFLSPRSAVAAGSQSYCRHGHRNLLRPLSSTASFGHERLHEVLPPLESFPGRHMGPSPEEIQSMLKVCGLEVCGLHKPQNIIFFVV